MWREVSLFINHVGEEGRLAVVGRGYMEMNQEEMEMEAMAGWLLTV